MTLGDRDRQVLISVAFHDPKWGPAACDRYVLFPEVLKIFTATAVGSRFKLHHTILDLVLISSSHLHLALVRYLLSESNSPCGVQSPADVRACSEDRKCMHRGRNE